VRRLLPAAVSAAALTAIYWRLDWSEFAGAVAAAQWGWLTAGLLLVVPTTLIAAWRFTLLVPGGAVRLAESLKLTLAASVLNLALPSKMGDLTKAWFASRRGYMSAGGALGVVLFEKAADLMALIALCLAGVLAARRSAPGWASVVLGPALAAGVAVMVSRRLSSAVHGRAPAVLGRLIEAWRSVQARMAGDLAASPPLTATLAPAALAILAGLVPVTLAGIGTRDAALVYLFRDYLTQEGGAALGLLCTLRYLMPAVAGLAILREIAAPAQWDSAPEGSRPSRPATRS